jgi:hypothetical protein
MTVGRLSPTGQRQSPGPTTGPGQTGGGITGPPAPPRGGYAGWDRDALCCRHAPHAAAARVTGHRHGRRPPMSLNPPDLRPDRARPALPRPPAPGPAAHRHGLARLPQGAGRFRAHPDPPARRGLRDLPRLCRRRGGDRQHLRLPRLRQGRVARGDRRGARRERPGHRHRLPRRRRAIHPRHPPVGPRRHRPAPVRGGARRRPRRRAARSPTPSSTCCRPPASASRRGTTPT